MNLYFVIRLFGAVIFASGPYTSTEACTDKIAALEPYRESIRASLNLAVVEPVRDTDVSLGCLAADAMPEATTPHIREE